MAEACQNIVKKLDLKNPSKRQEYLDLIDRLLEVSFEKAQGHYTKNAERIGWIRAITGLVKAGAEVLKDVDLEELSKRLDELEKWKKQKGA
jgi:hypothetical protein